VQRADELTIAVLGDAQYGVCAEHYPLVGAALLETTAEVDGAGLAAILHQRVGPGLPDGSPISRPTSTGTWTRHSTLDARGLTALSLITGYTER
jgi:hypothetical protein